MTLLVFSLGPVAFLTVYSVVKYQKAIDNELRERLMANAREIGSILVDFKTILLQRRDHYFSDTSLLLHLSLGDELSIRRMAMDWMKNDPASGLTFYARNGRKLVSVYRNENGVVQDHTPSPQTSVILAKETLEKLKDAGVYALVEHSEKDLASLIVISKVFSTNKKHIGFVQQNLELDTEFLNRIKEKMKIELVVLRANGLPTLATLPDFGLTKKNYFQEYTRTLSTSYFEHMVRGEPHGFLVYPVSWGNSDFFIALGASKREAQAVLRNVNYAFYSMVLAIVVLLILTTWIVSSAIVRPIWELVAATYNVQSQDETVEIPVTSRTEIGLLTHSFNAMSRNILSARAELKKKIIELERANQEIRDAQSKLLLNSKMVSLGQLVAGVAHELNNPIGFIYSNMSHLRDYSERLLAYADGCEKDPAQAQELREELEIEYIRHDLPKLVKSCEEGALRTREIVRGLRNFSRLEATELKEMDVHEAIESTLNLLTGEIKNRITIDRQYQSLPKVQCFSTQIAQVFMNILSNAAHAINGSGRISIATRLLRQGGLTDRVEIAISDTGAGISPENLEKVFDPFFSTKEVGRGMGLGLSISYGIVHNHGGEIFVRSASGQGSTFTIVIPVQPDPALFKLSKRQEPA